MHAELDPAWRPWVRLVDIALASADEPAWSSAVPALAPDRAADAPLLHGASVRLDRHRVRRLILELLNEDESDLNPSSLIHAAITQDDDAIDRMANESRLDAARLGTVAQLAALPLLRACAARYRDEVPSSWAHGYCPVCGAWPAIAELRGLDRSRRLRCGRCAYDWPITVLRCPYCDELSHDKLHALVPEGHENTRRVEVCESCRGYIKTFSTLQAMSPRSLATTDLASVELDIVAHDHGYRRPSRLAYPLALGVT